MHERHGVARNPDGRRGARLDAHHDGFVRHKSPHPPPEGGDPPAQPLADKRGHPLVEPRRDNTGDIGGLGQGHAGASGYEIGDALRRGDLMLAAVLPGQLFELLLEL